MDTKPNAIKLVGYGDRDQVRELADRLQNFIAGASKLTHDIGTIMAELPAMVEGLSGVDIRKLIDAIPALKAATGGAEKKGA